MINEYDDYLVLDACENHIEYFSDDTFEKLQKLVDLQENFYKFTNVKESHPNHDCTYAEKIVSSYCELLNECHKYDDAHFCNVLETFRGQYNTYMENQSICDEKHKCLPSTRKYNLTVIILVTTVIVIVISFAPFILSKVNNIYFSQILLYQKM